MKRYIKFLMIALSAGAVLAACTRESDTNVAGGKEIRFSASVGQFQVKATASGFEEGDAIGLFSTQPVEADNARLSFVNGVLTPDIPIRWGEYQPSDQAVTFYAYYPYAEGLSSSFDFSVPVDQTDEAAYKGADLMIAATTAKPSDDAVQLHFAHRMVRAVFNVINRVGGEVTELVVNNVAVDAYVNMDAPSVELSGDAQKYSVKAAPVMNPTGAKAWAVIVPSQLCEGVSLSITLDNGKEYTVNAGGSMLLEEGRSYNVNVIIDDSMTDLAFNADITDWLDDWSWMGKDNDPGKLPVTWAIYKDGEYYQMEEQEDGLWHVVLSQDAYGAEFQVAKQNNYWDSNKIPSVQYFGSALDYSFELKDGEQLDIALVPDRYVRIYSETRLDAIECWLDPQTRHLTVSTREHEWEYLGTGKMLDALFASMFGVPMQEFDVDIDIDANIPGIYRIRTPYKNWECPEGFSYSPGDDLIIYLTDGNARFDHTFTGIRHEKVGYIYYSSSYGYFDEGYNGFYFWGAYVMGNGYDGEWISFDRMPMFITLPGGSRPVDMSIELVYQGYGQLESAGADGVVDDTVYAVYDIYTGMDVQGLRLGLYSGTLSTQEIRNVISDVAANGQVVENTPQGWIRTFIPVSQTGTYTLVAVGLGINGKTATYYDRFSVLLDEEAPEASITVTAAPGMFAEAEVNARVVFENPAGVYALIIEDDVWQQAGVADDDIFDYVMSNGVLQGDYKWTSNGMNINFSDLDPETKYRVLVAGISAFEKEAWAQCEVTTGAAPKFAEFGIGHYADNFENSFGPDGYYTEVQILKANTDPERYRVMEPYKAYWEKPNEGYDSYSGRQAPWIDICIDGDNFYYLPYLTGYLEEGFGAVEYSCRNKLSGNFYAYNAKLQEGVYNIAPMAYILGTNYVYNLTSFVGSIYLEMPGYTYTKPADEEVNHAPARSNVPAQGNTPQTEVRPFTRHMLHGTPIVTAREN